MQLSPAMDVGSDPQGGDPCIITRRWSLATRMVPHRSFQVTDIFDHNGQACGGMVDINTKYQSVTTMTDHLARQLGVAAESLTIIQDTAPSTDPSLPT